MKYDLVLFDLDGTLTDTLGAISKIINATMEEMGLKTYSKEESRKYIGYGVQGIVERIFEVEKYDKNKINSEKMLEIIRKYYKIYFNYNVKLYKDIDKLLNFLEKNEIKKGIVTNKDHDMAIKTVRENLSRWDFVEIIGADDEKYPRKLDPYGINLISGKYQIPKNKILFVGDMDVDIETAARAGVDIAYCKWGFGAAKNEKGIEEKIKVSSAWEIIEMIK